MTINLNFDSLLAWFKSKNITTHSIAAAAIFFATLYTSDQQFRDFVLSLVKTHPKIAADIGIAVGIILKYSRSTSAAGTVAAAEKVLSSNNPPSAAAVAAVLPKGSQTAATVPPVPPVPPTPPVMPPTVANVPPPESKP